MRVVCFFFFFEKQKNDKSFRRNCHFNAMYHWTHCQESNTNVILPCFEEFCSLNGIKLKLCRRITLETYQGSKKDVKLLHNIWWHFTRHSLASCCNNSSLLSCTLASLHTSDTQQQNDKKQNRGAPREPARPAPALSKERGSAWQGARCVATAQGNHPKAVSDQRLLTPEAILLGAKSWCEGVELGT